MMMVQQIYAQSLLLAGELPQKQKDMLQVLCRSASACLTTRLREGLTAEDCKADFIAAASLLALAALSGTDDLSQLELFQAGDMTLRRGSTDAAANCLRNQAHLIMAPYLRDSFSFMGV